MNRSTQSQASYLSGWRGLALAIITGACLLACTLTQPADTTPTADVTPPGESLTAHQLNPGTSMPEPALTPTMPEPTLEASTLGGYGVTLLSPEPLSSNKSLTVFNAVSTMGSAIAAINPAGSDDTAGTQTFAKVFGPTVIHIYPNKITIDGVHAALNCGWEGNFASGCRETEIFPEQEFPKGAWLILIAGGFMDSSADGGVGLVAHEIVHNLTWGGGHLPENLGGYSYVRYVGDEFAIRYMDNLGVEVGRETYETSPARDSFSLWRAELTADALSSWGLGQVIGPDGPMVSGYIHDLIACKVYAVGHCR